MARAKGMENPKYICRDAKKLPEVPSVFLANT